MLSSELEVSHWTRQADKNSNFRVTSSMAEESEGSPLKRARTMQLGGNLEVPDDGFMWLKYGQKHIRGTQHQRNYYRCSMFKALGCPAKKTVDFRKTNSAELRITDSHAHNHPCRHRISIDHVMFQMNSQPINGRPTSLSDIGSVDIPRSEVLDPGNIVSSPSLGGNLYWSIGTISGSQTDGLTPAMQLDTEAMSETCSVGREETISELRHWGQALQLGLAGGTSP